MTALWLAKMLGLGTIRDRMAKRQTATSIVRDTRYISRRTLRPAVAPATAAEFFAGIGLVRTGLEAAGWQVIYANDNSPQKHALYEANFGSDAALDPRSIEDVSASDVPSVTLATASFPCTDVSLAGGKRGLAGSQSKLFWCFADIIAEMGRHRPPLLLIENVVGLIHSRDGADLEACLRRLNQLGYDTDALLLDACHFVSQSRPRMFMVAIDSEWAEALEPDFWTDTPTDLRGKPLDSFIQQTRGCVHWRFKALPDISPVTHSVADIIDDLPATSELWWSDDRVDRLIGQMSERHLRIVEEMRAGHSKTYATVFRRMRNGRSMAEVRNDGLAGCLRTPKGGSARQILIEGCRGRCRVRLLTPRECARLMGAPNYRIPSTVSSHDALFGFGDAVCVPAITWIAEHYLNPIRHEIMRLARQTGPSATRTAPS